MFSELCRSPSSYKRKLFIDVCSLTMDLFSHAFFKDHFFDHLLSLCDDPIPNVRLRVCPMLPKLQAHIRLPTDRPLLIKLEGCVRKMMRDERNRDVLNAIEQVIELLLH